MSGNFFLQPDDFMTDEDFDNFLSTLTDEQLLEYIENEINKFEEQLLSDEKFDQLLEKEFLEIENYTH